MFARVNLGSTLRRIIGSQLLSFAEDFFSKKRQLDIGGGLKSSLHYVITSFTRIFLQKPRSQSIDYLYSQKNIFYKKECDMTDLTSKQKALVDTLVTDGGTIKEAALVAGYSQGGNGESGRVVASKTLRLPHVQEYMRQQMMLSFGMASPKAFMRMVQLVDYAKSEHVQLEASKEILNRAGFTASRDSVNINTAGVIVNIDLG